MQVEGLLTRQCWNCANKPGADRHDAKEVSRWQPAHALHRLGWVWFCLEHWETLAGKVCVPRQKEQVSPIMHDVHQQNPPHSSTSHFLGEHLSSRNKIHIWGCQLVASHHVLLSFAPYTNMVCVLVVSDSWRPMDCSPPGSSVHGIFQARILEWVAISSSRGSFWPRDWTHVSYVSCIGSRFLSIGTIWEALYIINIYVYIFFKCFGRTLKTYRMREIDSKLF